MIVYKFIISNDWLDLVWIVEDCSHEKLFSISSFESSECGLVPGLDVRCNGYSRLD